MPVIPLLDYYLGREVIGVDDGDEGFDWAIHLWGDVLIQNHDESKTEKPELDGLAFMGTSMTELDTVLRFGNAGKVAQEITLTPTEYSIADQQFPGGPHFPQRLTPEEESLLPVDPSAERVADGPDEVPPELAEKDAAALEAEDTAS